MDGEIKKIPIISVYNNKRKELVEQTYRSIRENTLYPYELFTLEDTVGDDSNYIKLRNQLMNNLDYGWDRMVYIDDDIYCNKGWLTKMMQVMDDNPDVWQVSGVTWHTHKHLEVRKDITITDINSGGALLFDRRAWIVNDMEWDEGVNKTRIWCANIQALGEIAFLNNREYTVHCGVNSILSKGKSEKNIKIIKELAKKVGAITK